MESLRSKLIKRALITMDFKRSTIQLLQNEGRMVRSGSEQPSPDRKTLLHLNVTTQTICGRAVHSITSKTTIEPSYPRTVLFLHGGAYLTNLLPLHWAFMRKLVDRKGVRIIAPDYPLAPRASWHEAFDFLDEMYRHSIAGEHSKPLPLTIIGDSAGAGLALAWCVHLRNSSRDPDPSLDPLPLPGSLVLLSPWVDLSMTNPEIAKIEPYDPYLSAEALRIAGCMWAADTPIEDWHVSPLHGDLTDLPPIHVFTGTADILNPDAHLLKDKLEANGSTVQFHEYESMMHDWMMFSLPEADRCIEELLVPGTNLRAKTPL